MNYTSHQVEQDGDPTIHAVPLPMPIVRKKSDGFQGESVHDIVGYEDTTSSSKDGRWGETSSTSHLRYPYMACGRLFTTFEGSNYSCSASLIGKRLVLTAGHCVSPGASSRVHKNIKFFPNYPAERNSYDVETVYVMEGWARQGLLQYDVAILRLKTPITDKGYHGVAVDIPFGARPRSNYQHFGWWSLSYPSQPPFDGSVQISDGGPPSIDPFRLSGNGYFWGKRYEAVSRSDLTKGASGGPMFINPSNKLPKRIILNGHTPTLHSRIQYVNGVNSFKYDHLPNCMLTPYFGSAVREFIQKVISDNI